MENIAKIRDLQQAISLYEEQFETVNRVSLNEAIILISLKDEVLTAGQLAKQNNLSASNTSKIITKIEKKWLIERVMDKNDKRKMLFSITKQGKSILSRIRYTEIELPDTLKDFLG